MKAPHQIETRRLVLSPPRVVDAATIFERYASDPDVTRFLGWPRHQSVADTEAFVTASRDLRIEAVYLAHWGHTFFGIADGPVASFTVATTTVAADGTFALKLPDLAGDPVVMSFDEGPLRGVLRLIGRETETGNIPYAFEEMQQAGREVTLPVATDYPRDLLLVAVPR